MRSWCRPQNSAQRPLKVPIWVGVKVNSFGRPGRALRMNRNSGTKNSCTTSRDSRRCVDRLADRHRHHRLLGEPLAGDEEALVQVVEGPLPLEALDAQVDSRVGVAVLHLGEGLLAE